MISYVAGWEEYWRCLRTERSIIQKRWAFNHGLLCYLLISRYIHYYEEMKMRQVKLFLDSGAFSAWTKGVKIDLDEYIEFIKKYKKYLEVYANLDVIGSAEETYHNQKYMEKKGLNPLPVFHLQDDFDWLEKYIAEGYDYIGIGGIAGKSTIGSRMHFLDRVWNRLTDHSGFPTMRVHGFGMTAVNLIVKYPWYCMTEENHEVLTQNGWKDLSKLSIGEKILAFDNGKKVWQKIEEIPIFNVKNELIQHLYNRNFECFVTNNHRWLVSNHNKKGDTYEWRITDTLKVGDCIDRCGKDYEFPKAPLFTDNQVGLLAWFWTDGSIKRRKQYKNDSVVIYQSYRANSDKCSIIRKLLLSSNEKFCETKNSKDGTIIFELYGKISKWILSIAPDKKLPITFPFSLTKKQAEMFLNFSILADGSLFNLKGIIDFQIGGSKNYKNENLEVLRIICLLLGISTLIYENNEFKVLRSSSVNYVYVDQLKKKEMSYTGNLWCVRVKSGAFFVRCKNHIYVTGNSVDSTSWLSASRLGDILIPRQIKGESNYLVKPLSISVSDKSPNKKKFGKHFFSLTKSEKVYVKNYLAELNLTFKEVRDDYKARDRVCVLFYQRLQDALPKYPWAMQKKQKRHIFI